MTWEFGLSERDVRYITDDRDELRKVNRLVRDRLFETTRELDAAIAQRDEVQESLNEAESYAAEGWKWLDDALAALGIETVFDIAGATARSEVLAEALREAKALVLGAGGWLVGSNVEAAVINLIDAALAPDGDGTEVVTASDAWFANRDPLRESPPEAPGFA